MNNHFKVLTDNNPLTYVLTSAKLHATGQRWAAALEQYNFDIFYRLGMKNTDADAMSRYPHTEIPGEDKIQIENKVVKAICNCITLPYLETLPFMNINIIEATESPGQLMAALEV